MVDDQKHILDLNNSHKGPLKKSASNPPHKKRNSPDCSLREEKFTAAEIVGKFTIIWTLQALPQMYKYFQRRRNALVQQFTSLERKLS